jgi:hypothetical protein
MAPAGLSAGVVIALGVPFIVLTCGTNLGVGPQTAIIIIAVLIGGACALSSAFFGTVIPKEISGGEGKPKETEKPAEKP